MASSSSPCSAPAPVTESPRRPIWMKLLPRRRRSRERMALLDRDRSTRGQGADRTKRYATVLLWHFTDTLTWEDAGQSLARVFFD